MSTVRELLDESTNLHVFDSSLLEKQDHVIIHTIHRDSDAVSKSNHKVFSQELEGEIETIAFNHWLCGWIEHLIINPNSKLFHKVQELQERLAEYPILDEDSISFCEQCDDWYLLDESDHIPFCSESCMHDFETAEEEQ